MNTDEVMIKLVISLCAYRERWYYVRLIIGIAKYSFFFLNFYTLICINQLSIHIMSMHESVYKIVSK